MSVINGVAGAVDGANTVGNWSISSSADLQDLIASNTKSMELLLPGNEDWTGSYQATGHTPYKFPNDAISFKGSYDGVKGAAGDAMITGVEITWDKKTGKAIEHVVNFAGNGVLNLGASVAADATTPNPSTTIDCNLDIGSVVDNLQDMKLTLSADCRPYPDAGVIKRLAGNFSGTMSYASLFSDPAVLPARNTFLIVKMYVDAIDYWELKWMVVGEHSDVKCDIITKEPIGATVNCRFSGFNAGAIGYIKKPGGVTWWPPA